MRKITKAMTAAFMSGVALKMDNTEVTKGYHTCAGHRVDCWKMFLFGNEIARRYTSIAGVEFVEVSNAGWTSATTKDRLNGIPGVSINQKARVWYLNGCEWDGSWVCVSETRSSVAEKLFRVRVDYNQYNEDSRKDDPEFYDKVEEKAFKFAGDDVHYVTTGLGPCWDAYIVFEGPNEARVNELHQKIRRYIERFSGAVVRT